MPQVRDTFEKKGVTYDKVREIILTPEELKSLGIFRHETRRELWWGHDSAFSFDLDEGVYIYQRRENPLIAYRVPKLYHTPKFSVSDKDYKLIQWLQEKQDIINLTKFPTGVLTCEGRLLGQEIPYYEDYISIYSYFLQGHKKDSFEIYSQILDILEELYKQDILYLDIHGKNFLINPNKPNKVELIDFEEHKVKFEKKQTDLRQLFWNLKNMLEKLSEVDKNYVEAMNLCTVDNFDDMRCLLDEKQRKLTKKTL